MVWCLLLVCFPVANRELHHFLLCRFADTKPLTRATLTLFAHVPSSRLVLLSTTVRDSAHQPRRHQMRALLRRGVQGMRGLSPNPSNQCFQSLVAWTSLPQSSLSWQPPYADRSWTTLFSPIICASLEWLLLISSLSAAVLLSACDRRTFWPCAHQDTMTAHHSIATSGVS